MDQAREHSIIPEGLERCVWMDAGVVSYKLCDRFLQCNGCPFDALFRQHCSAEVPRTHTLERSSTEVSSLTVEEYIQSQLDVLLSPFMDARLPDDRRYCANHTWLKKEDDETVLVGLDHLGTHVLNSIACIVLPETPMQTHAHSPCAWIMKPEGAIALRTPVPGVITRTNDRLKDDPSLITGDPYREGWIFEMLKELEEQDKLLTAARAGEVFSRQGDALRHEFIKRVPKKPHLGVTLHDGGHRVESLQEMLGSNAYFSIIARIFISGPRS